MKSNLLFKLNTIFVMLAYCEHYRPLYHRVNQAIAIVGADLIFTILESGQKTEAVILVIRLF